jgi:hypothetical protein
VAADIEGLLHTVARGAGHQPPAVRRPPVVPAHRGHLPRPGRRARLPAALAWRSAHQDRPVLSALLETARAVVTGAAGGP